MAFGYAIRIAIDVILVPCANKLFCVKVRCRGTRPSGLISVLVVKMRDKP